MNAKQLFNKLFDLGDSYIFFTTSVSKKQKYHICTVDLSTPYIKNKMTLKDKVKPEDGFLRVFCWDLDEFKLIRAVTISKVLPLNTVISKCQLTA